MCDEIPSEKRIFLEAVERHAPEQWASFLDTACGSDARLRSRVEALLEAHCQSNRLLDGSGPVAAIDLLPECEEFSEATDRYTVLEKIGEGGYGSCTWPSSSGP